MIYLDTSALVKLVVREEESQALIDWINDVTDDASIEALTGSARPTRGDCCTSQIGVIELLRAALRLGDEGDAVTAARRLLAKLDILLMTPQISELAQTVPSTDLRTLDALHLSTVLANQPIVTTVCAYDHRLIAACHEHGLAVVSPGA